MKSLIKAFTNWLARQRCYESNTITMGQPYGQYVTVHCCCGDFLSNRASDWIPIEATRRFETVCRNCGPVQVGRW